MVAKCRTAFFWTWSRTQKRGEKERREERREERERGEEERARTGEEKRKEDHPGPRYPDWFRAWGVVILAVYVSVSAFGFVDPIRFSNQSHSTVQNIMPRPYSATRLQENCV